MAMASSVPLAQAQLAAQKPSWQEPGWGGQPLSVAIFPPWVGCYMSLFCIRVIVAAIR